MFIKATDLTAPHYFANMASTTFSLAGKGLKFETAEDIKQHTQSLSSNTSFSHIDLSGNTFGVPACEALAPLLSSQRDLKIADLHDIYTSQKIDSIEKSLPVLVDAFLQCPKLHTIDLSDNAFGFRLREPLGKLLSNHVPLKHLILNNNGMGPDAGTALADALTRLAEKKAEARKQGKDVPDLESIVCGRNRLETGSARAWANAYKAHGAAIKSVKMTQNGIRPEGVAHLLRAGLSHCTSLEVLDMQDNTFTITGSQALADVVGGWSQLKELGVGDSLLGANGANKVFEVLAKGQNKGVEVLRLQYNDITARGVQTLLRAAKDGLPALRRVELNGNKFNEDDSNVEALAELLSERKDGKGSDEDPEEHWGLDELDELEEEDSDEEDEEAAEAAEEEDEEDQLQERVLKEADQAENEKVSQKNDPDVDELAGKLGKTSI